MSTTLDIFRGNLRKHKGHLSLREIGNIEESFRNKDLTCLSALELQFLYLSLPLTDSFDYFVNEVYDQMKIRALTFETPVSSIANLDYRGNWAQGSF